jgi:hypothetical protein
MFPEDHLLDPQPAMTRRERRDRKDAERKASEAEFMRGFYAAEVDHEDGATPEGILERAEEAEGRGYANAANARAYYDGRIAYAVANLTG